MRYEYTFIYLKKCPYIYTKKRDKCGKIKLKQKHNRNRKYKTNVKMKM